MNAHCGEGGSPFGKAGPPAKLHDDKNGEDYSPLCHLHNIFKSHKKIKHVLVSLYCCLLCLNKLATDDSGLPAWTV